MQKSIFISSCLFLFACGGSDNSGIEQNVAAPPAQSQPVLQSTTDTIAADGHTFAMFKSHDISFTNSSSNLVTVQLMDENQTILIQTSLTQGQSKSLAIQIPEGNEQTYVLWSGRNSADNSFASEKYTVDISQVIVFNGFN
jgi:hypothetical protein